MCSYNYEVSGSRAGGDMPLSFNIEEACTFHKVQPTDDATACLISVIDVDNFITLDSDEREDAWTNEEE
jgi:hypothetical protein